MISLVGKKDWNGSAVGLLAGIAGAATYGMNPLFALPLYAEGFSADAVLFLRYVLAIVMIGVWMVLKRESFRINLKLLCLLAGGGVLFSVSSLCLFSSYQEMDAGIASTLLFVYPVMTSLLMWAVFREKTSVRIWVAMILALSGIALLYRKADGSALSTAGVLLVMGSSLSYAVYLILVNKSALKKMRILPLTFYVLLFGVMLFAVRLAAGCGVMGHASFRVAANVFLIALLPTAVSLFCTSIAVQKVGATVTAILGALEPVTAVVIGVTVFQEMLSGRLICGIALILGAVILIAAKKK